MSLAALCNCSKNEENLEAKRRIWNNEPVVEDVKTRSAETIALDKLESDQAVRARVLGMKIDEVTARFGFFEYTGKARIVVAGGKRKIDVTEDTTITQGLHGSFTVRQKNERGEPMRELVYNNGMMFIKNGTGVMRAQGVVKDQHIRVRDEAWEPLSVFTRYFGPRVGLKKVGTATFMQRDVVDYQMVLLDGPELIEGKDGDKAKKPLSLKGQLLIDVKTAVVLRAKITGKLEVPEAKVPTSTTAKRKNSKPKQRKAGTIRVYLTSKIKPIKGEEQRPKKFVDAIQRHPTDLNPLAFMKGDIRTSTVIGGKKTSKKSKAQPKKDFKAKPEKPAKKAKKKKAPVKKQ